MKTTIVGKRIKELRTSVGMSQQELGDLVGLTATGIFYWESGKTQPSIDALEKIMDYFGVSFEYLLGISDLEDEAQVILKKVQRVKKEDKKRLYNILNSTVDAFLQVI